MSGSHADASFDADVWVGDDGLVRRIRFSPGSDGERIVMQTELFDYGVDVHVEAPPPAEVIDFSDLAHGVVGADAQ